MISFKEAQEIILGEAIGFGTEEISLEHAAGRIIAENIPADRNYPPFNRSAVDGFAIRATDLETCSNFSVLEEVHAGTVATKTITAGTAIKIMTGAPVPDSADAVIKVEDAIVNGDSVQFKPVAVSSWTNIAREGEDILKGTVAVPRNTECTPQVLGMLASMGKHFLKVYKQPLVHILSTGNEIRDVQEQILPHQIRDSNAYTLEAFFLYYGIKAAQRAIIPDEKPLIQRAIRASGQADILIISGGVSMGDADFVPEALRSEGVTQLFHKTAIKPGKPIWFGKRANGSVVFALPGNPFSCQVAFKVFIENFLRKNFGLPLLRELKFQMAGSRKKKIAFDEFFPCRISEDSSLEPTRIHGSGDIHSLLGSDGIALFASDRQELLPGDYVSFFPWKPW